MVTRKLNDGMWQCRGVYRGNPFDCRDVSLDQAIADAEVFMFEIDRGLL